ncbi:hypothetical protein CLV24_10699 [Pontibacter ummariensis]|uniref:PhnA-like protein n=1 Tax=Pontibacter ummariensis TaxID=1610492 RepID=A0A239EEA3_9BACT|nr:hypothetical protein [Pontibacter ummariensis]PRY13185.1 hypothetical protein CLV24_10699 [Pontibacter ummariensis]SNS42212.1 hypothetical protein SAMN06296052_10699 [Pontibacter ummariensis]
MEDNLRDERGYTVPVAGPRYGTGLGVFKRISWGAVFAGLVVALVVQLAWSLLGLGIGFGTINPVEEQDPMAGLGTGALIWWIVSTLVSLFIGGWVAGRLAGMPTTADSILHGIITWSLFTLLSFYLLTTAVGRVLSGVGSLVGDTLSLAGRGIAAVAPEAANAVQGQLQNTNIDLSTLKQEARQLLRQTGKEELQPENLEEEAQQTASNVQGAAGEAAASPQAAGSTFDAVFDRLYGQGQDIVNAADREAAINIVMERTGRSRAEAEEVVNGWVNTYEQAKAQYKDTRAQVGARAQEIGGDVASAVSKAAIYSFFGLLLGAIAAAIGGKVGEPKDLAVATGGGVVNRD